MLALVCALGWAQDGAVARAGRYEVRLRLPAVGLSAQEEMQIEYRVSDATQVDPVMGAAPVIRALTRSSIGMPAMPGMAKLTETGHAEGVPGEYGVHPVFPHGGEYRLELFITPPGGAEFRVEFPLVVADGGTGKSRKARPFYAQMRTAPKSPQAGEPVELRIQVFSRIKGDGALREFDRQHERNMHLIIVRSDLGSFAHEHPEMGPDGTFVLRHTFSDAGQYTLFIDAAPKGAGGQVMAVPLRVGGKRGERFAVGAPEGKSVGGSVAVTLEATQFAARRTLRIGATVCDVKTGEAVRDLQPYLGALGHFILVHEDGETFVHSHPDELDASAGKDGRVTFLARFPKPGRYRGWMQMQRNQVVETVAFVVAAGER